MTHAGRGTSEEACRAEPVAPTLVVDDEENVCYLVSTALRLGGWTVQVSDSGQAAIGVVEQFRPDVIVLDVMLGDADGFELCERLRRRGSPPRSSSSPPAARRPTGFEA